MKKPRRQLVCRSPLPIDTGLTPGRGFIGGWHRKEWVPRMTSEETVFAEALGKASEAEQASYLDQACQGDAQMRRDVDALLAAHRRAGGILEAPLAESGSI